MKQDNNMDINKISSHINGKVNGTDSSAGTGKTTADSLKASSNSVSDKVSLNGYTADKSEAIFARIELEKLNSASFSKLKEMNSKIEEYEAAKKVSPEAAAETEIGKMINDPDVFQSIAEKIIG